MIDSMLHIHPFIIKTAEEGWLEPAENVDGLGRAMERTLFSSWAQFIKMGNGWVERTRTRLAAACVTWAAKELVEARR